MTVNYHRMTVNFNLDDSLIQNGWRSNLKKWHACTLGCLRVGRRSISNRKTVNFKRISILNSIFVLDRLPGLDASTNQSIYRPWNPNPIQAHLNFEFLFCIGPSSWPWHVNQPVDLQSLEPLISVQPVSGICQVTLAWSQSMSIMQIANSTMIPSKGEIACRARSEDISA